MAVPMGPLLVFLLLPIFATSALADGPPVKDDGTITAEHIVIKLTARQLIEVGTRRFLTLTEQQREQLGPKAPPIEHRYIVLTPLWRDCTCGMPVFAIWNRLDSVAIPVRGLERSLKFDEYVEAETNAQDRYASWQNNSIVVDARGNPHHKGVLLSKTGIKKTVRMLGKSGHVVVNRPPHGGKKLEARIKSVLEEIRVLAGPKVKVAVFG